MKRAVALFVVLCAVRAGAASGPQNEVRADLGVGSAVGFGGLSYARALGERLSIEAGAGYGISGFQLSAMPKLLLPSATNAFFIGLGPAISIERLDADDVGAAFRRYGTGVWLNADFGYRIVARSGLTFTAAAGASVGLWGSHMLRVPGFILSDSFKGIRGLTAPQARVGCGYAF